MGINTCTFSGNVGKDPEIRFFENGKSITTFSVAVPTYQQGEKGTLWLNCKAWNKTGEVIGEYVKKGVPVTVTGSLEEEKWTDSNGNEKSKFVLNVRDVQLPPKESQPDIPF